METELRKVREFWSTEACGSQFVQSNRHSIEFFKDYRKFRYSTEWHIPSLVPFSETRGQKVLEIGCGNGADGSLFAECGADYTGIDLTETAVNATKLHFEYLGLPGTFQVENAESLSFASKSFDFVYSHGVLHHTPCPKNAFAEVYRVLKPGGRAILMLYHRNSFNYFVRIMFYMRMRAMFFALIRLPKWKADREVLRSQAAIRGVRGNEDKSNWLIHYENFLRGGWSYFSSDSFVSHCTDGPECPYAAVYSRSDVAQMFSQFSEIKTQAAHFPLKKYKFGKWLPFVLEEKLAKYFGWYLFIFLRKS